MKHLISPFIIVMFPFAFVALAFRVAYSHVDKLLLDSMIGK